MVGETTLRSTRRPAEIYSPSRNEKHRASDLVVLHTRQDKEEALRAVGGNGARWLDNRKLGDLFASMYDGFEAGNKPIKVTSGA